MHLIRVNNKVINLEQLVEANDDPGTDPDEVLPPHRMVTGPCLTLSFLNGEDVACTGAERKAIWNYLNDRLTADLSDDRGTPRAEQADRETRSQP